MTATKTTILVITIAILLTFTVPTTVFADEYRSDDHDDKDLFCELVDHDDKDHHDDHDDDDKKHHDDERHNA